MKTIIKLTSIYLNILSYILPKYSGKKAFEIFQKVRLKNIKNREQAYYVKAKKFSVALENEALQCYEFVLDSARTDNIDSAQTEKIVFLIHGWESNAGSLTLFANALAKRNYRVIGFDLPGHGTTKEKHTNLYSSKIAFIKLIEYINPKQPISIISHSFGSAVTSYVLPELDYKIDKVVFLSSNNKLIDIFMHYKNMIGFNKRVFNQFKILVQNYLNEEVSEMVIAKKMNQSNFNKLLIIHDKFDKVIPFKNAKEIHAAVKNSTLIPFEKIGHYRMLWNEDVVKKTVAFIDH